MLRLIYVEEAQHFTDSRTFNVAFNEIQHDAECEMDGSLKYVDNIFVSAEWSGGGAWGNSVML